MGINGLYIRDTASKKIAVLVFVRLYNAISEWSPDFSVFQGYHEQNDAKRGTTIAAIGPCSGSGGTCGPLCILQHLGEVNGPLRVGPYYSTK